MLFEVLAGGTFHHLNCQHTGEFHQDLSKQSNAHGIAGGFGIDWYIISLPILAITLSQFLFCLCIIISLSFALMLPDTTVLRDNVTMSPFSHRP